MDESFYVPKVYWDKVTQKVLTMEKIIGVPADKIDELNEKKVNKKETYICKEEKPFFIKFWTEEEWSKTATMTFLFILENL